MSITLIDKTDTWIIVFIQFIVMLVLIYSGARFAKITSFTKSEFDSNSSITTAIYSLVALMLAFTFSMSGSRYDSRKTVIVQEANDIGTAILRADMYKDSVRTLFREDFKNYVEARIAYYEAHGNIPKVKEALESSDLYAGRLWARASKLSQDKENLVVSNQMIPALNNMIDIANTRLHGELYKIPDAIILLLFGFLMIATFIFGFLAESKGRINWYIAACFCIVTALTMYFMIDLDRPRRGLINLDESNMAIVELRKMF